MARPSPPVATLRGYSSAVHALAFLPSTSPPLEEGDALDHLAHCPPLLSGTLDGTLRCWSMSTRRVVSSVKAHKENIVSVVVSPSQELVITRGRDGFVHGWKYNEAELEQAFSLPIPGSSFCGAVLCGDCIAAPAENGNDIELWDAKAHQRITVLENKERGMVGAIHWISKDLCLAGYEDGTLVTWDISYHRPLCSNKIHRESILSMDRHNDRVLTVGADDQVAYTRLEGLETHHTIDVPAPGFSACAIRSDGKICASGGWDGKVRVFGWKKPKKLAVLAWHRQSVQALAFDDTNWCLASGGKEGRIALWSIYS